MLSMAANPKIKKKPDKNKKFAASGIRAASSAGAAQRRGDVPRLLPPRLLQREQRHDQVGGGERAGDEASRGEALLAQQAAQRWADDDADGVGHGHVRHVVRPLLLRGDIREEGVDDAGRAA